MWLMPKSTLIAMEEINEEGGGSSSSIFLTASPSAIADASGNRPRLGRGSKTPLSDTFTICSSCLAWIHSSRLCFHSPSIGMAVCLILTELFST